MKIPLSRKASINWLSRTQPIILKPHGESIHLMYMGAGKTLCSLHVDNKNVRLMYEKSKTKKVTCKNCRKNIARTVKKSKLYYSRCLLMESFL